MEIVIRPAITEDLKTIQRLNLMLFEKEFKEFDSTLDCQWTFSSEGTEYFTARINGDSGCAFVAIVDDKIVGYLAGGLMDKTSCRTLTVAAELENMFILEEYRGLGLGSKLYHKFFDWSKSKGVKRLRVVASAQNKDGISFYHKNGFHDHDLVLETDI